MPKGHILVGFSGGVDSAAAIYWLQAEGYRVTAVHLLLYGMPDQSRLQSLDERATFLKTPLVVLDRRELFQEQVNNPFTESYLRGETPNPCVGCNETVKLKILADLMGDMNATGIATGHYARKRRDPKTGQWTICRGEDKAQEQSYFLSMVTQDHLSVLLLPLGDRTKMEVRILCGHLGLPISKDEESHEVCFLEGEPYPKFVATRQTRALPKGTFIDASGKVLGTHEGYFRYTVGQRRGIGIADETPYYVTAIRPALNQVEIGKREALYRTAFQVRNCRWRVPHQKTVMGVTCQIRYRHKAAPATVRILSSHRARVVFESPQRAITPGQVAAFYREDCLIGAGVIEGPVA